MDWQLLITTLQTRGLSQSQIAAFCGCSQSTISDLVTGTTKRPNFELGQKLVALNKSRRKTPAAQFAKAA